MGKANIYEIDAEMVSDFVTKDLRKTSLSQKTKFNIVANLKTIVNYAKRHNKIKNIENPFFQNLKNPRNMRQRNPDVCATQESYRRK